MKHFHYEWSDIGPGSNVAVSLDKPAKVLFFDDANYKLFVDKRRHVSHGGMAEKQIDFSPTAPGTWHLYVAANAIEMLDVRVTLKIDSDDAA
jgi:hypothetical protein